MKTSKLLLLGVFMAAVAFTATVRAGQHEGEKVDLKSLPAPVQKTINEKAAGGKISKVMKEDDADGKWNYEVFVKTNGKEWCFEVNPKGKFVKKH